MSETSERRGRRTGLLMQSLDPAKLIFAHVPGEGYFTCADLAALAEGHRHTVVLRWNNRDIETASARSPAGQWGFVKLCGRTKHAFPLPSINRVHNRWVDCVCGWIHFHGHFARLIKAEFGVYLHRSYSVSTKLAGSLFAESWGVGGLRVGSKWCMPSNTPLSSSHPFEGGLAGLPAQEEFTNSCRGCICALLFSKAKNWKSPVGSFTLSARGCTFVSILSALQHSWCGGQGGLSISSWKQVTGRRVLLVFSTSPPLY